MNYLSWLCLVILIIFSGQTIANDQDPNLSKIIQVKVYDEEVGLAKENNLYLNELINKAKQLNLAKEPTWVALLHYKKRFLVGIESQVDSPDFFLSAKGKHDPQAELHATIASFFSDIPVAPGKYSPQCRFPARYYWLSDKLDFDSTKLAVKECKDLNQYYEAMAPESLTVVFPSTHPNSPSSMFGHTLLRVNKKGQTEETRMLAFSINYAAQVDPAQGGLSYTVLGLTGGFPGKFMVVPYYVKLREYAQIENRDLWEYQLNIPKEKLRFILLHTFELAYSYFDYYFFTENCSYHLLSLLDVAYPETPMADEFVGWTIPIDTLKTLRKRGLIGEARFYPSIARKIEFRKNKLSREQKEIITKALDEGLEGVKEELNTLPNNAQIEILDFLTDYLRFAKIEKSEESVSSRLSKPERQVLLYRSKIREKSLKLAIPQPGISPDKGHNTSRLGLSIGRLHSNNYYDLEWRPAYHDILDASAGFVSNSSLEFMKLKLRYKPQEKKALLQEVNLLSIESLEPRDQFFRGYSWTAHVKWFNESIMSSKKNHSIVDLNAGGGVSYKLSYNYDSLFYGFFNATSLIGKDFKEGYSILPGLSLGYIVEPINRWRINIKTSYKHGILGERLETGQLEINQSFAIKKNISARLNVSKTWLKTKEINAIESQLLYYF